MSNSALKNNYCLSGQQRLKFIENLNNEYNTTHGLKSFYLQEPDKNFNNNQKQFKTLPPKDLKVYEGPKNIDDESKVLIPQSTRLSGKSSNVLSGVCIPRYIPQFIDVQNPKNVIMDIPRGGISTR
jgi:hypothetical protein